MYFEIGELLETNAYLSFGRINIFNRSLENRRNKIVWLNDTTYEH